MGVLSELDGAAYSEAIAMASGIVQGSFIGPILFVIYVNDLIDCFDKEIVCNLYADDIKLYTYIRSLSDCSRLQLAIDRLVSWSIKWQLRILSINVWFAMSEITVPRLYI